MNFLNTFSKDSYSILYLKNKHMKINSLFQNSQIHYITNVNFKYSKQSMHHIVYSNKMRDLIQSLLCLTEKLREALTKKIEITKSPINANEHFSHSSQIYLCDSLCDTNFFRDGPHSLYQSATAHRKGGIISWWCIFRCRLCAFIFRLHKRNSSLWQN